MTIILKKELSKKEIRDFQKFNSDVLYGWFPFENVFLLNLYMRKLIIPHCFDDFCQKKS